MKLYLEEVELRKAITLYVKGKVRLEDTQHLEIEFVSGRNPPSVSASVDIISNEEPEGDPRYAEEAAGASDDKPFSDEQQTIPFNYLGGD